MFFSWLSFKDRDPYLHKNRGGERESTETHWQPEWWKKKGGRSFWGIFIHGKMETNMDKWDMLQPGKKGKYIQINISRLTILIYPICTYRRGSRYIYKTLVLSRMCIFLDVRYNHFHHVNLVFSLCTLRFLNIAKTEGWHPRLQSRPSAKK